MRSAAYDKHDTTQSQNAILWRKKPLCHETTKS